MKKDWEKPSEGKHDDDDDVNNNVNNEDDDDDDDVKAYFYDETAQHLFFENSASALPHWIKECSCRRRCFRLKLTQFWCALVSMLDN